MQLQPITSAIPANYDRDEVVRDLERLRIKLSAALGDVERILSKPESVCMAVSVFGPALSEDAAWMRSAIDRIEAGALAGRMAENAALGLSGSVVA